MDDGQFKPGVAAIIIIALGILIFTLLFIFGKRQIMRVAQKFPTDGPHAPIGYDAPKKLCLEIDRRLNVVKSIQYEPKLINGANKFSSEENVTIYKHINRMKAVDSVKELEEAIVRAKGNDQSYRRSPGQELRVYLFNMRKEGRPLANCDSKLINEFVESYTSARSDPTPDFGPDDFLKHMSLLNRLISTITVCSVSQNNSPAKVTQRKNVKNLSIKSLSCSPTKKRTDKNEQCLENQNETCV